MQQQKHAIEILSRTVGAADALIQAQDNRRWTLDPTRAVMLDQLYGEAIQLRDEGAVDDAPRLLLQCLSNLEATAGALGDTEAATKWSRLASCFLPFVRTDLACLIDAVAHVPTTDQDYALRKAPRA